MDQVLLQYSAIGVFCLLLILAVRELDKRNLARYKAIDEFKTARIEQLEKELEDTRDKLYMKMMEITQAHNSLILSNNHTQERVAQSMEEVTKYLSMLWERELKR